MAALIIDTGGHLHVDSTGLCDLDADRGMTYGIRIDLTGKVAGWRHQTFPASSAMPYSSSVSFVGMPLTGSNPASP